ncbi:type I-F CRISPR-associated protein Csy2 [Glaciecola siphonariae]|uniref:Type I-F CRISPR-associated protein Csy2 n=1 Tax=Glaciecola siphonariae TaxID=521012 RepID=A0ABV9LZU4_9ALTE
MASLFLVAKDVTVDSCNVSTSYMTNAFPTSAVIGLIDAFRFWLDNSASKHGLDIGFTEEMHDSQKSKAFAIVKSFSTNLGKKAFPAFASQGGSAHKSISPSELQLNETTANIQASLVFELKLTDELDSLEGVIEAFRLFLQQARFAGGKITSSPVVEAFDSRGNLEEGLSKEKGWVLKQAYERFEELSGELGIDQAMQEFSFTYIDKEAEGSARYYKKHKGWLFFNLQGYQFIGAPTEKDGSRNGHPHVFAEPVINLNEFVYFRAENTKELFWYWEEHENCIELTQ